MYSSVDDWKKVEGGGNRIPIVGPDEDVLATERNDGSTRKAEDTTKAEITKSANILLTKDTLFTETERARLIIKVSKVGGL